MALEERYERLRESVNEAIKKLCNKIEDISNEAIQSELQSIDVKYVAMDECQVNKDQSLIKRAVPINRFLYSTTVQNFTHLSYSFRVTTPIIGAGHWHGPKKKQKHAHIAC